MAADWTDKTLSRKTKFYQTALTNFSKQYKNIDKINRVFINDNNKVFAAEWVDKSGVLNIIGGVYPDIVKTINFTD